MSQPLNALILAAGYGTRLGKIGETTPKGLLSYKDTNLITHVLNEYRVQGISNIAVVTNDKYLPQYQAWAASLPFPVTLISDHTSDPANRLGALGDLRFAINQLNWHTQDLIVAPSDTYFDFSLKIFLDTIRQYPSDFATIVRQMDPEIIKNRLGCARLSETGEIIEFIEKPSSPPSPYAAIPFYYYPSSIHSLLNKYAASGNSLDAPGNIIPWLISQKLPVHACIVTENTIDVGTQVELATLQNL